jgi:hypothetical protein
MGLSAFSIVLLEVMLRAWWPTMSWQFRELAKSPEMVGIELDGIIEKISYRSGDELAVLCGFIGTGLMAIAAIYPMFRRFRVFRWMASNTMWFDFHMMAGWVGPMFIGLHSALKLDSWVASAFWSMVIVVVSGAIGRYLYTMIPAVSSGNELEELDHERAFSRLRQKNPVALSELDAELALHRQRADAASRNASLVFTLVWLFLEDARRLGRWFGRRRRLGRLGVTGKVRRDLLKRTGRRILIDRGRVTAPQAQRLLHAWKWVHVPFTIFLVALATAHIYNSLPRAW